MKRSRILQILLMLLLGVSGINAQSNKWKTYRAYQNAEIVEATSNYIFGVYDGSLLSYSLEDESVKTYSLEDGLSAVGITLMKYHPGQKCLIIVYGNDNGNIDLFFGKDDIQNIPYLKNNTEITKKKVNSIDIINDYAYVSGEFGVMVIDLKKREVKEDYRWGINVKSICLWNGYLYASTSEGLLKADPASNLKDLQNWVRQPLNFSENDKSIRSMLVFNNHLVFEMQTKGIYYVDENYSVKTLLAWNCNQIALLNNQLVAVMNAQIDFYSDFSSKTTIPLTVSYISSNKDSDFWVVKGEEGLVGFTKTKDSSEYTLKTTGIKLNSPLRNYTFRLKYTDNKLLVTGGGRWGDRNNSPGTFMVYENNKWYNLDNKAITEAIREQTGVSYITCKDLISAIVDPLDSNHFYVSSWGEGVYELQKTDGEFELIKLHTYNNTNNALQTNNPSYKPEEFVRVDGLVYDKNNNLFMLNAGVENMIVVKKNDNTWTSFFESDITGGDKGQAGQLIIAQNNWAWGTTFRKESALFAFNYNNTLNNTLDDTFYRSRTFTDQQNRNVAPANYLSIIEDMNGIIWVGTDIGLIYFTSPNQIANKRCNRLVGTDEYGQGYYVLEGIRINAAAIDGADRKWFGTESNGVFVLEQLDGEIKVENFNITNSNILSNKINSIAIDSKSGEVFIATDKGLCSYKGGAAEGKSDYSDVQAFPNPVYPSRRSEVVITGLMSNSTIKITDIAGNLIKEATSMGGQYTWDCTAVNKELVKSGIYLVFATAEDGSEGVVTKIMVIK